MRALVVFESMFGNTAAIARAVADGLGSRAEVTVVEVGGAPVTVGPDVDLLVVGGPTHAFGMSRASTRRDAARYTDGPLVSTGIGMREWLAGLERGTGTAAAAFDTRIRKPRVPGSAARAAARRLRRLGFDVAGATSFHVEGATGPLVDGEAERARRWGEQLVAQVGARPVSAG